MAVLGCVALQQDDAAMGILIKSLLLLRCLLGLHLPLDPRRIVLDERLDQNGQDRPMAVDDATFALDLFLEELLEELQPGILLGRHELVDDPLLVVDEARLDLRQLGVFCDSDLDRNHARLDLQQELLLHLIVLGLLGWAHLVVADRLILAREIREPILLLRLEDVVFHRPGERLGVLGPDDLLVLPAAHDAEGAAERIEVGFAEQADGSQLAPQDHAGLASGAGLSGS